MIPHDERTLFQSEATFVLSNWRSAGLCAENGTSHSLSLDNRPPPAKRSTLLQDYLSWMALILVWSPWKSIPPSAPFHTSAGKTMQTCLVLLSRYPIALRHSQLKTKRQHVPLRCSVCFKENGWREKEWKSNVMGSKVSLRASSDTFSKCSINLDVTLCARILRK